MEHHQVLFQATWPTHIIHTKTHVQRFHAVQYHLTVFCSAISLPENVVSANTVNTFKNRLDKFWSDQELVYDYKADLTGIGNRSLISLDDTSAL